MVSTVSAKTLHPLSTTHSSALPSKQPCHYSLVSSPHRCKARQTLVPKNKWSLFPPKHSRKKHCSAQQSFGTSRTFMNGQSSKDIWLMSTLKLTSGQPLHRWKPLMNFVISLEPSSTHFKLPTLFSKPSWTPGYLQQQQQIIQQKSQYFSIWSQISLSVHASEQDPQPWQISWQIFAAKPQEKLQCSSGQCKVPFSHTTFSQGCKKGRKKKNHQEQKHRQVFCLWAACHCAARCEQSLKERIYMTALPDQAQMLFPSLGKT